MRTSPYFSSTVRWMFALTFVLSGAIALVGCDTVGTSDADDTTATSGQLTVNLTDAPGDILEAYVTIERVAVVPSDDADDGEAEDGGIEVLSDDPITVDLVTLQDGVTETLGSIDIPEGTYSQIRLVTAKEATVLYEDADGESQEAELMLPSADETGIKINFSEFAIDDEADEVEVTLDFDVEESFVKAGESGKYIFKPVVHAESVVANGEPVEDDAPAEDDAS